MSFSSSSDDEEMLCEVALASAAAVSSPSPIWGGKKKGSRGNIDRGPCSWYNDYLHENPIYPHSTFRRRFRVPMKLFRLLERELPLVEPNLRRKTDCTGRCGAPPWQKHLPCLRRLGEGCSFSSMDDQARLSAETMRVNMRHFKTALISRFGCDFLNRRPTTAELTRIEND